MLFAYRASRNEYLSLRELFERRLRELNGARWAMDTPAERACFVLYAAEWWRRDYDGGPWRWMHILESLGPRFNLHVDDRSEAVRRGLHAWRHFTSNEGKRFLGAIVAQGGLPLQMVARGDGAVAQLLTRGLRQRQRFGWEAERLEGFFHDHEAELVPHLRQPEIHRLLASVVDAVLALRAEFKLAGAANPVALLDDRLPAWRERFPIAVDDAAALALLNGLVREAARELPPRAAFPVTVTRSLREEANGGFVLQLSAELPTGLPLQVLAEACSLAPDDLPQSFALELAGARRLALGSGRQVLGGDEAAVMLAGRGRRLQGEEAAAEQLLVLRATGSDLHEPAPIPGAEALDVEMPWVFACHDAEAVLVATGACRLPARRCLVAVAASDEVHALEEQGTLQRRGVLHGLAPERWVYELAGAAVVRGACGEFTLRTDQAVESGESFVWQGRRAPHGGSPLPVYLGVPRLRRLTAEGLSLPVAPGDVEWVEARRQGGRIAQPRQHRGPVDAWLLQDGVRQRRFRMVLLAPEACIRFHSGATPREGTIEFHGWGVRDLTGPPELVAQRRVEGDTALLALAAAQRPPATVRVDIAWPPGSLVQHLDLPFPAKGGRFVDADGRPLPSGSARSLRQLHGLRVQVFDQNPHSLHAYTLAVELGGCSGAAARRRTEIAVTLDAQGVGELRLLELEAVLGGLMCQSNELDARLELALHQGPSRIALLLLTRYDADLVRGPDSVRLPAISVDALEAGVLAGVRLRALPLLRAVGTEVDLAQDSIGDMPTGHWTLSVLCREQGPWLVFPTPESTLQVRPTLFDGLSEGTTPDVQDRPCALGQAMAERAQDERLAAIGAVVAAMAADPLHRGWDLVLGQHQRLAHLPLSTFDYWRAIGRDLAAGLAVALRVPVDEMPALMQRMRTELGVMWELTPRSLLRTALAQHLAFWANRLPAEAGDALVRLVAGPLFQRLGQAEPMLAELVDSVLYEAGFDVSETCLRLVAELAAGPGVALARLWQGENSLLQRFLLRSHGGELRWPTFNLAQTLAAALDRLADDAVRRRLAALHAQLLWLPGVNVPGAKGRDERGDVANVPLLAGLLSQLTEDRGWWSEGERLAQLRQLRNFDPAWFETALRVGRLVALCVLQPAAAPRPAALPSGAARDGAQVGHPGPSRPAAALPSAPVARAAAAASAPSRPVAVPAAGDGPLAHMSAPVRLPVPPAPTTAPARGGPSYGAARRVPRTTDR